MIDGFEVVVPDSVETWTFKKCYNNPVNTLETGLWNFYL